VPLDHKDPLAQVPLVLLEHRVPLDHKDHKDPLVTLAQVPLVLLAHKALQDLQVDLLEPQVLLDLPVLLV
jgi:hypothetical protein